MVGARQGAGHYAESRERIEGKCSGRGKEIVGKHSRHTGVLHAHFDAQSAAFGYVEAEKARHHISEHISYSIVAEHHSHGNAHYIQSVAHELRMHGEYHAAHYHAEPYHANARHDAL